MQQDEARDDFIRNRLLRIEYFYFHLKETVSLSWFSSNPQCGDLFLQAVVLSHNIFSFENVCPGGTQYSPTNACSFGRRTARWRGRPELMASGSSC